MKTIIKYILISLICVFVYNTAYSKTTRTHNQPSLVSWLTTEMNRPEAKLSLDFASIRFTYKDRCVYMYLTYKNQNVVESIKEQGNEYLEYIFANGVCTIIDQSPYNIENYVTSNIRFKMNIMDSKGNTIKVLSLLPQQYKNSYYEFKKNNKLGDNRLDDRTFFELVAKNEEAKCPQKLDEGMIISKVALEGSKLTYYIVVQEGMAKLLKLMESSELQNFKHDLAVYLKEQFDDFSTSFSKQVSVTNMFLERMKRTNTLICYRYISEKTNRELLKLDFSADELINAKKIEYTTTGTSQYNKYNLTFTFPNTFTPDEVQVENAYGLNVYGLQLNTVGSSMGDWIQINWFNTPIDNTDSNLDAINSDYYEIFSESLSQYGMKLSVVEKKSSKISNNYARFLKAKVSPYNHYIYFTSFTTIDKTIIVTMFTEPSEKDAIKTEKAYQTILNSIK